MHPSEKSDREGAGAGADADEPVEAQLQRANAFATIRKAVAQQ